MLPAYPDGDAGVLEWPEKFRRKFPTFEAYKEWCKRLFGILADSVAGRKLIQWAKDQGITLKTNPSGYPRAFPMNPSQEQLVVDPARVCCASSGRGTTSTGSNRHSQNGTSP